MKRIYPLPGVLCLLWLLCAAAPGRAQDATALERFFVGQEVTVKLDMPGSQKGVDLRFNKATPMDWKEYSGRLKQFGVALRKGDVARVTTVVVKSDMIEFQLDGGGFGTFGDDTQTTVTAQPLEKSDYEKSLEQQIADTTDDDRKRSLQRDLDRERARREKQDAKNRSDAQVASQMKAQQVSDKRMRGGSRFNLRWNGSVPAADLTPEGLMQSLAEYIDFRGRGTSGDAGRAPGGPAETSNNPVGESSASGAASTAGNADSSPTALLKRGMKMSEVEALLGSGRQLSESTGSDGLKTQVVEYHTDDRLAQVTYVEGVVVRFSISSR
ncbi:MAG TPA: hypothetical protein VMT51_01480 [Dongiaceae bacterium]|nr:hypothetical protein [Dongiaceae bacterium]